MEVRRNVILFFTIVVLTIVLWFLIDEPWKTVLIVPVTIAVVAEMYYVRVLRIPVVEIPGIEEVEEE